jgi:hypothetical protein
MVSTKQAKPGGHRANGPGGSNHHGLALHFAVIAYFRAANLLHRFLGGPWWVMT